MAKKHTTLQCPPMHVHRVNCPVLPPEQFELLNRVHPQLAGLCALLARAVHAYEETSYDTCLILIWAVIENLISKRYDALLTKQGAPPLGHPAKERKRKERDVSKQIQALHQQQRSSTTSPRQL